MKNKITKRIVSTLLSTLVISSALAVNANLVSAVDDTKESKYLVLTESDFALNKAEELSSKSESVFSDDNTTVAEVSLTKSDVNTLKNTDGVIAVEKNVTFSGSAIDDNEDVEVIDYLYKDVDTEDLNLWYLDAVGSSDVDNGDKVKIELLDSGVNLDSDIKVEERINLIEGENVSPLYEDLSGHGTGMASVIKAKDNGVGVTGINPNAKLYSVRVLDDKIQAPLSRIVEGIQWGIDNNMDIINMSFGTNTNSAILREVIQKADEAGILLVSATGNDPDSGVQYPAAYPEVLAVGSMNENFEISDFTSVGEEMDVVAPGEKIETAGIFGTINGTNGTSISTAQVSAVASKILEKDNSKSPDFVKGLILASAKKIQNGNITTGAVDSNYALEIYDEYERTYTPKKDIQEYTNPNDTVACNTEGFVAGLWGKDDHEEMVREAYDGTYNSTGNTMALIVKGARMADNDDLVDVDNVVHNFKEISNFHGHGNYAASLKCAWRFVYCLHQSNRNGESRNAAIKNAAADATNLLNSMNLSTSQTNNIKSLINALKILYKIDVSKKGVVTDDRGLQSTKFKAMGLCMHLVADTFAHRTLVPNTDDMKKKLNNESYFPNNGTVDFTKSSNINDLKRFAQEGDKEFNTSDTAKKFKNMQSLFKAIELQIVEFTDIRWFSPTYPKTSSNSNSNLEPVSSAFADKPGIFKRRYREAQLACTYLAQGGYKRNADIYVFIPFENMKLWNLKNYVKAAGYDISVVPDEEWDKYTAYKK